MRLRDNDTKKLVLAGVLAAVAIVLNFIEGLLPPMTSVPGIKLGIANVVTLFAANYLGFAYAAAVQIVRILVGGLISGSVISTAYSFMGGAFALAVIRVMKLKRNQLWAVSSFAAIANSIGQTLVAYVVMLSEGVFAYLPYMIIASIIAGVITGLIAQIVLRRLS